MAITSLTSERLPGGQAWRVRWSSDLADPTYYVYVGDVLALTTKRTWADFTVRAGETLAIQVFDDAAAVPAVVHDGRVAITWERRDGADLYRLEQWDGAAWAPRHEQREVGEWLYQYTTPVLDDCATARWRVVPVGTNLADGAPQEFSWYVAREPDAPEVTYSYDPVTGLLTVEAV